MTTGAHTAHHEHKEPWRWGHRDAGADAEHPWRGGRFHQLAECRIGRQQLVGVHRGVGERVPQDAPVHDDGADQGKQRRRGRKGPAPDEARTQMGGGKRVEHHIVALVVECVDARMPLPDLLPVGGQRRQGTPGHGAHLLEAVTCAERPGKATERDPGHAQRAPRTVWVFTKQQADGARGRDDEAGDPGQWPPQGVDVGVPVLLFAGKLCHRGVGGIVLINRLAAFGPYSVPPGATVRDTGLRHDDHTLAVAAQPTAEVVGFVECAEPRIDAAHGGHRVHRHEGAGE